jgi:hypothetical protein
MSLPGFRAETSIYQSTQSYRAVPSAIPEIRGGLVSLAAMKICTVWGEGDENMLCADDPGIGGGGSSGAFSVGGGSSGGSGGGAGSIIADCSDKCDNQNLLCGSRCDKISDPTASARCNSNCDTILNRCLAIC